MGDRSARLTPEEEKQLWVGTTEGYFAQAVPNWRLRELLDCERGIKELEASNRTLRQSFDEMSTASQARVKELEDRPPVVHSTKEGVYWRSLFGTLKHASRDQMTDQQFRLFARAKLEMAANGYASGEWQKLSLAEEDLVRSEERVSFLEKISELDRELGITHEPFNSNRTALESARLAADLSIQVDQLRETLTKVALCLLSKQKVLQRFIPGSEAHALQAAVDEAHGAISLALSETPITGVLELVRDLYDVCETEDDGGDHACSVFKKHASVLKRLRTRDEVPPYRESSRVK